MKWLEDVKEARAAGSFTDAMEILNREIIKRPADGTIYYQIACTHDALGRETDAAPNYERAIELGLSNDDLKGALLGLGSTYRSLGEYKKSEEVFLRAMKLFPDERCYRVFLCMTLFNLGRSEEAVGTLLKELAETTSDASIKPYARALLFYSDKLSETFD
jgi:tetratricopeptide (TPR) repeat protein